jgi:hypothetical protein
VKRTPVAEAVSQVAASAATQRTSANSAGGGAGQRILGSAVPYAVSAVGAGLAFLLLSDVRTGVSGAAFLVSTQTVLVFAVGLALFVVDGWFEARGYAFATELTSLVLEAGQSISEGLGVESGLFTAAARRGGPAGKAVARLLERARDRSLEEALHEAASGDTREEMRSIAALLAHTVEAEGDVGERMRSLAKDLSAVARAERLFTESLGTELVLFAGLGLLVVPALFCLLGQSSGFVAWPSAMEFFAMLGALIAVADGAAAWSLHRALRRAPLYIAISQAIFVLGFKVLP